MKKYKVLVEEWVSDTFYVYAKSQEDAVRRAEEKYKNCEIVLEPGYLLNVEFSVLD